MASAQAQREAGHPAEARRILEDALKRAPSSYALRLQLAQLLDESRDTRAAEILLGETASLYPAEAEPLVRLARLAESQGRRARAVGLWQDAYARSPQQAGYLREAARVELDRGLERAALALLDRCLEAAPGDAVAWLLEARTLLVLEDPEESLEAVNRSLEEGGPRAEAMALAARCQAALGREEDARATFEQVLKEAPRDPEVLSAYGCFLAGQNGEAPRAEQLLREALTIAPSRAEAAMVLAGLLAGSARLDEALSLLRETAKRQESLRVRKAIEWQARRLRREAPPDSTPDKGSPSDTVGRKPVDR